MPQREIKLGIAGKRFATLNWVIRVGLTEVTTGKAYRSEGGSQANMEESCRQGEQWVVCWEHAIQGPARTPSFLAQNVRGGREENMQGLPITARSFAFTLGERGSHCRVLN